MQSTARTNEMEFWWQNSWGRRFPVAVGFQDRAIEITGPRPLRLSIDQLASASFHVPRVYDNDSEERRRIIALRDRSGRDWTVHASLAVTEQVQSLLRDLAVALDADNRLHVLFVGPPRSERMMFGGFAVVGGLLIAAGGALFLGDEAYGPAVLIGGIFMFVMGLSNLRRRRIAFGSLQQALAFNLHDKT